MTSTLRFVQKQSVELREARMAGHLSEYPVLLFDLGHVCPNVTNDFEGDTSACCDGELNCFLENYIEVDGEGI